MPSARSAVSTPRLGTIASFYALAFAILLIVHLPILDAPYFWDELGQFVPATLDILEKGAWIPQSTLPNVHPPGVMAYLAIVWKIAGVSVQSARLAMLALAAAGVLFTFLLAVELLKNTRGMPAFFAPLLLLASPLFVTQSMLVQLDMPAMVFTLFALWLFVRGRIGLCAAACTALVLMKETGALLPAVLSGWLILEKRFRSAIWFAVPILALGGWLVYLESGTGHWLGNREFAHYNVGFQIHPVRLGVTFLRRLFYLFVDNFHWVGTIALVTAWRHTPIFRTRAWAICGSFFALHILAVTVLGGAALERYLLPALPLLYIAMAGAFATMMPRRAHIGQAVLLGGLIFSSFIHSPFPYPFENSLAMIDFVRLQKLAAEYVEQHYEDRVTVSAWPFSDALRRPEFGYVSKRIPSRGIGNFDPATVLAEKNRGVEVLVIYSRTWEPEWGALRHEWIREFLARYYFYQPQITAGEIHERLGLVPVARWERNGQWIAIFARSAGNALTI